MKEEDVLGVRCERLLERRALMPYIYVTLSLQRNPYLALLEMDPTKIRNAVIMVIAVDPYL